MTKQIKIPLLPLPPIEERRRFDWIHVCTNDGSELWVHWCNARWLSHGEDLVFNDFDILGIIPDYTIQDGHLVFKVEK